MAQIVTSSQYAKLLAEMVDMSVSDIKIILEAQRELVTQLLQEAGNQVRVPVLPGLITVHKNWKKAVKAHKGPNPFTGETIMFKAKPAHFAVKASVTKKLKDVAGKSGKKRR